MTSRLLLIDDDARLTDMVGGYLRHNGFDVDTAGSLAAGREQLKHGSYDALLLDLMLPDGDGLDLCRSVRGIDPALPIIMLTARGDPASRVVGLELGADGYISKPFEPRELVARIHALLRRAAPARAARSEEKPTRVSFRGWRLDRLSRELHSPQQVLIALSAAEFRLLTAFVDHPRRVLSRDRLGELSRGTGASATERAIDLAVSRLRSKLGDAPREPALIRTMRGEGYMFDADVEAAP